MAVAELDTWDVFGEGVALPFTGDTPWDCSGSPRTSGFLVHQEKMGHVCVPRRNKNGPTKVLIPRRNQLPRTEFLLVLQRRSPSRRNVTHCIYHWSNQLWAWATRQSLWSATQSIAYCLPQGIFPALVWVSMVTHLLLSGPDVGG